MTRTFRQTPSEQPSYAPITSVSEPAPSTYGVPQSAPVYTPTTPGKKKILRQTSFVEIYKGTISIYQINFSFFYDDFTFYAAQLFEQRRPVKSLKTA